MKTKLNQHLGVECECSEAHSITKLGHAQNCPYFTKHYSGGGCVNGKCPFGAEHNFEWATYEDDRMGTGVCQCGVTDMSFSMATMP